MMFCMIRINIIQGESESKKKWNWDDLKLLNIIELSFISSILPLKQNKTKSNLHSILFLSMRTYDCSDAAQARCDKIE